MLSCLCGRTIVLMSSRSPKRPENRSEIIPKAPTAHVFPLVLETHGDQRIDEYAWMRQRGNPDVFRHIEAENVYGALKLRPYEKEIQTLETELRARVIENDTSVAVRHGSYEYYSKVKKGKEYRIHMRTSLATGKEQVVLDENEQAQGSTFFRLGSYEISPDEMSVAYSIDTTGDEHYTLFVENITTRIRLTETIERTDGSVVWCQDGTALYYMATDNTHRPYRVMRHRLDSEPDTDQCVYEEKDARFLTGISLARSLQYVFIHNGMHGTCDAWVLDAYDSYARPRQITPREQDVEYHVEHAPHYFLVRTNKSAQNWKVMRAPLENTRDALWVEWLPESVERSVEDIATFEHFCVIESRSGGSVTLSVRAYTDTLEAAIIPTKGPVVYRLEDTPRWESEYVLVSYESLVHPVTYVRYTVATKKVQVVKEQKIPGYNPKLFITKRMWAPAEDGVLVPVTVAYKTAGSVAARPTLLCGYGAYGDSYDPRLSQLHISLMQRGWAVAIAHVRGGGELGRAWYEAGSRMHKRTTFTDFIACAEYLKEKRIARSDALCISGGSAGGLLIGAVLNMRPSLACTALVYVPFVDAVNTMLDSTLPLTTAEYGEWGNPNDRDVYEYMKSYAPYENVSAQNYPSLLVRGGLHDSRVAYWEPLKWVARLRALKTDENTIVMLTEIAGGHGGKSGRYARLRDTATDLVWLLAQTPIRVVKGKKGAGKSSKIKARKSSRTLVVAKKKVLKKVDKKQVPSRKNKK
jgi:oligopeptidase B